MLQSVFPECLLMSWKAVRVSGAGLLSLVTMESRPSENMSAETGLHGCKSMLYLGCCIP